MEKSNIKGYQRITANILYIIEMLNTFLKFQRVYKNSFQVFIDYLTNKTEIKVFLKNKKSFILSARSTTLVAHMYKKNVELDFEKDTITMLVGESGIILDKEKIIFYNGIENGDIYNIFIKNEYQMLKTKGKVIVDIGANIGDSAIYFAIKGAEKIIGFEPFYNNYIFAKKNFKENLLEEKCNIFLAGCSGKSGKIKLNSEMKNDVDSKVDYFDQGEEIPLYSLDQIINDFNVPQKSILKMDCEGCEYESILLASRDTLRTFDEILLEYHHGYLDVVEKLKKCGFNVSNTTPISTGFIGKYLQIFKVKTEEADYNNKKDFRQGYSGLIHAIKNN